MKYPLLTIDLHKLRRNVDLCAALCHEQGITFAAVTKGVCADRRIASMLEDSYCDWLADARLENLRLMHTKKPKFLIRLAQSWEAEEVVRHTDISLQSEPSAIALLGAAAARQGKRHRVILSCDLGDLREGCFFRNEHDVFRTAEAILAQHALELYGVGMNLGCFGGVLPCGENMTGLVSIARALRERFHIPIPIVSGGSSSLIHHLIDKTVVPGINSCRMGELWLTGHDPGLGQDIPVFFSDGILLSTQLVEVKVKPSKPMGPIGGDAFGVVRTYPDLGPMRRGILACGKQDVDLGGMFPLDGRLRILGGSSDYTLVNLTAAPEYKPGDVLRFRLNYAAIMRAFTSPYVYREYLL